jgi:hypothetical protein
MGMGLERYSRQTGEHAVPAELISEEKEVKVVLK